MAGTYALKRALDFYLSLTGFIFSLPLWLLVSFLIWFEDGRPIFYLQERVGENSEPFQSIKFRSMIKDAEKNTGPIQAKAGDSRVTRIGRLLRKTALDELPQLLNILKGDMSFVGPRALRPVETEAQNSYDTREIFHLTGFEKRVSEKPGLTGVAQVYASRILPREGKFKYDLWYVDNMSLWLDIKLIARSFLITFKARWDT